MASEAAIQGAALSLQACDGKAQWVQLLATGPQQGRDGRGPFEAGNPQGVISRSFAAVAGGVLPIDYDHATDLAAPKGGEAPAAGWISKMEARPDGLWGFAEWTPKGGQAVREREYRFLSPVLAHDGKGQVLAILRASLTNNPNLNLVALNAARTGTGASNVETDVLAEIRPLLGLPDDATGDAIVEKLKVTLASAGTPDPARYVPIAMFQRAVAERIEADRGVSLQAAEIAVDSAIRDRRIMPWMKGWAVDLCMQDKTAFDTFVDGAGKQVNAFLETLSGPSPLKGREVEQNSRNRGVSLDPGIREALRLSDDDIKSFGGGQ